MMRRCLRRLRRLKKIPSSSQRKQFNVGLRFPLPALFKEFLHFTQIPPAFIHPNIVRHVRSPALPSIGDGAAGAGSKHPARPFSPNYSLVIPGPERGAIVDWVEKASFACLNKLFEIDAKERHYKTLLSARNLMAVDLPIYQEFKEADAEKRRALLDDREKRKNEGTLRKAPGQKRATSPPKKAPAKKRKLVKNGKGVKEPTPPKEFASANYSRGGAVARLANLAEEAASINHPAPLIRMSMQLKPFVRPRWRKQGRKPESAL
ncbi:hypothetical protein CK203_035179 [Vitis vinifera]|uniref:Uncharacterized protein n=1 Tax=Vitis vinifera TaxID=29760 RepID=A0A438HAD2_VITVI|nr:hypothetical protein CK203_035179 [Vitis vinifera]